MFQRCTLANHDRKAV